MNTPDDTHPPPTAPDTIPAPPDPACVHVLPPFAHNGPVTFAVEPTYDGIHPSDEEDGLGSL